MAIGVDSENVDCYVWIEDGFRLIAGFLWNIGSANDLKYVDIKAKIFVSKLFINKRISYDYLHLLAE